MESKQEKSYCVMTLEKDPFDGKFTDQTRAQF